MKIKTGTAILSVVFSVYSLVASGCKSGPRRDTRFAFEDPSLPLEERVNDLVARLTLEEKISQMGHEAPAVERLGIPAYNWWNECLHGVARAGLATVFPQSIGLAATWNTDLMFRVAGVISDEARAKHHEFVRRGKRGIYQGLTFWSPNINLFRDPRWGRGMETYGEDPYLSGTMAVSFIEGLQGDHPRYLKLVATAKHYAVHSGPEPDRHTFDAVIDAAELRRSYLPHFEMAVGRGRAYSVMCAYNRFLGLPCCGSRLLLDDILRKEWGFEGYVVSDCGAVNDIYATHKVVPGPAEAAAMALEAGTDLNCGRTYRALLEAVRTNLVSEELIDLSVKRLFMARFRLGMFDPEESVPYAAIPYSVLDGPAHRALALEAARESLVLLKNQGRTLPLSKTLKSIAVIGPNADDVEALLGNYNGTPADPVTPLRGIKEKTGPVTEIIYAAGTDWAEGIPVLTPVPEEYLAVSETASEPGLKAEYFAGHDLKGSPLFSRIDRRVSFDWWDEAPDQRLDDDDFGVRWSGYLFPPVSGEYYLGGEGFNSFKIFLEDELLVSYNGSHQTNKVYKKVVLEKARPYPLRIEFGHRAGDALMHLLWKKPASRELAEAVGAAEKAEAVVLFLGLSPRLEGEEMDVPVEGFKGGDRLSLDLPRNQEELLQKVTSAAPRKPVVLVLLNGSALAINWAVGNVPAIIEAWYPGQAAGQAIADVLFGDYNPAGRLPVTFYKSIDDLPPFTDYRMAGKTYRFFRKEPLFPFGFGLSYSTFEYSGLVGPQEIKVGESLELSFELENSGPLDGQEVIEVYLGRPGSRSPDEPLRWLAGYRRIFLKNGEKRTVTFTLTPDEMASIDGEGNKMLDAGDLEVWIGGREPGFTGPSGAPPSGVLNSRIRITGEKKILR